MKIGTKSLLFGNHQFLVHPIFVALSWWFLFGFPRDIRLWIAFLVHDWGYWGKLTMDGADGDNHPELGARIMARLFGKSWGDFAGGHSRSYASKNQIPISPLCIADKFAMFLTPAWCIFPWGMWTGEIQEYLANSRAGHKYSSQAPFVDDPVKWWGRVQANGYRIAKEYCDTRSN